MNDFLRALADRAQPAPAQPVLRVHPSVAVLAPAPLTAEPSAPRRSAPASNTDREMRQDDAAARSAVAAGPDDVGDRPAPLVRRAGPMHPERQVAPRSSAADFDGAEVDSDRAHSAGPRSARSRRRADRASGEADDVDRAQAGITARQVVPAPAPSAPAAPQSAAPPQAETAPALTARPTAAPGSAWRAAAAPPASPAPAPAEATAPFDGATGPAPALLRPARAAVPAAESRRADPAPTPAPVEIVIDRIDVRVTGAPPRPAPSRPAAPAAPPLSLADYLDRRAQR